MDSQQPDQITAGTGQPARPGGDDPVFPGQDWEDWYHTCGRKPASAGPPQGQAAAAGRNSKGQRVLVVVTGAAAVLAVFSSGVLYADLRTGRDVAAATTAQPVQRRVAASVASASPSPVIVQAPSNVPVVTQPVGRVRGAPPVRIAITKLGIDRRLVGLRVNANRELEVPQNYNDIGWWSTGPVPGDPGAAVIVGHVDSQVGPAVFYRLSSLTKGAAVTVRRADATTVRFRVTKVQAFSKRHFPDKVVYRTKGRPALHLVTCGGRYDRSVGYHDNVVVFADLDQPKTPPRRPAARHQPRTAGHGHPRAHPPTRTHTPTKSRTRAQPRHKASPHRAAPAGSVTRHGKERRGR